MTLTTSRTAARITTLEPAIRGFEDPFVSVEIDSVRFPDGHEGTHARVRSGSGRGAVAIVRSAQRGFAQIAFVRQDRYAVGRTTLELPRGGTDEDTLAGVIREVSEELGIEGVSPVLLGTIHPDTGLLTTEIDVYLVNTKGTPPAEHREAATGLEAVWAEPGEITGWIRNGGITCGITLASLALLNSSTHATLV